MFYFMYNIGVSEDRLSILRGFIETSWLVKKKMKLERIWILNIVSDI